jgi:4a-hydroxytetrahydrobiopterin dehydratase
MTELYKKNCTACDGSVPPFDTSEIHKYLKKVDGWSVESNKENNFFLIKKFKFKNFIKSQNFINKVGEVSESEGHHPDICFGWGYAEIKIFTHAIKGLTESDFILASKIDKLIIND